MHILLTGGTGLIGKHLCPFLLNHHKVTVLSRNPIQANVLLTHQVHAVQTLDEVDFEDIDAVINLAAEINWRQDDFLRIPPILSRICK